MNNKKNTIYITVKDHAVSGETFDLEQNVTYGFLQTIPQPSASKLPEYYKSEDYISHTNSRRNAFEIVYHWIRKIAIKRKVKLVQSYQKSKGALLDVGCGTGDFLEALNKKHWKVVGIEPNAEARTVANAKTNDQVFDIEYLNTLPPNSFDVITLWHVLEHLPNLKTHIHLLKALLKDKGTLIVAVPNYKSFDAKHYQSFWAAYDVPRHLWHFSQESIFKLFSTEDLKVVKTLPMKFDAYYVSLLSEKYKSGFMNPLKAFWVGVQSNLKAKRTTEYSSLIYVIKNDRNLK